MPLSDHKLTTLDAQPVLGIFFHVVKPTTLMMISHILDIAVNRQLTFIIQASGTVRYQDKIPKAFQQNFVITAEGDKWKIVSDCFRSVEPVGK